MIRTTALTLLALLLAACTSGGPSDADLDARLLGTDDLPTAWTTADDLATALVGGFCDLDGVVLATAPTGEAAAAFVDGSTMLRQSLFGYAAETHAADARAAIEQELLACPASDSGRELDIAVSERPSWNADTSRLRLEVDVADVPLVLDVAIWQQHDLVGVLRLTYPSGTLDDPADRHEAITTTARAKTDQS